MKQNRHLNRVMETGDHFKNGASPKSQMSRGNVIQKLVLYVAVFCISAASAFSQDIITLKNGNDIQAVVQEIGDLEVKYKKFENPNGPNYTMKKSEIFMIRYANGSKDVFADIKEQDSPPIPISIQEQPNDQTANHHFKLSKNAEIVIFKYDFRLGSNKVVRSTEQKMRELGFCCVNERTAMNESTSQVKIVIHPNGFSTYKFRIYDTIQDKQVFEKNYAKKTTINRVVDNFIKDIIPLIEK